MRPLSHADDSLASLESLVSKFMQVALVFNLAVGTKTRPVDVQFIGPGCSLPILKYRLQRLFNRKIMTSIVSYDIHQEEFPLERSTSTRFKHSGKTMSIYSYPISSGRLGVASEATGGLKYLNMKCNRFSLHIYI